MRTGCRGWRRYAHPGGLAGRRRPRRDADLGQHRGDVVVHRALGDEQPAEISRLGRSSAPEPPLASRQPRWSGTGGPAGTARDRSHPEFLHAPPGRRGGSPGAQAAEYCEGLSEPRLISGAQQGQRGVVGPAEPLPRRRRALPVPGDLPGERFRQAGRHAVWPFEPRCPDGQVPIVHGST